MRGIDYGDYDTLTYNEIGQFVMIPLKSNIFGYIFLVLEHDIKPQA